MNIFIRKICATGESKEVQLFRYNENYALERDLFVTDFGKTGNT